ncbi:MAG: CDP-alcohol phosphatidyltransferase family protein [Desulfobacterales bacterium]|nr:CDP-alcohol phosphatidyltransferase family protein [Desulfobacterales bacterium]
MKSMDSAVSIAISVLVSLGIYFWFWVSLKNEKKKQYISTHWFLHPNAICLWRVLIGLAGMLLYFVAEQHFWGILLFTFSAVADGIDGLVARECNLLTPFGEELDPLCDKITYLPPMVFFAHQGFLDMTILWVLIIIEVCGQFLVRDIIKRFTKFSVSANNFGKIKAVLCFSLIIYGALLDSAYRIPDFTAEILMACIVLSVASSVFKIISNHFYADILSGLNLVCGITGIVLVFKGWYVLVAIAILAGQIFDLFDGRIAEKHGGTKFGPWLDDIADMVSFGVCPGLLVLMSTEMKLPAFVLGIFYILAVGFRLWRFLIRDKHDKTLPPGTFNGLPSPAGAIVVLGACLFWQNAWMSLGVVLLTSFLLISHIRFVHFGRVILRRIPRSVMVIFGFLVVFVLAYLIKTRNPEMLGAILLISFTIYALAGNTKIAEKILPTG